MDTGVSTVAHDCLGKFKYQLLLLQYWLQILRTESVLALAS